MRANEMIRCELREDGFHVLAFRHDGKAVAERFAIEVTGGNIAYGIAEGQKEFLDEHSLAEFAREVVVPCLIKFLSQMPIHASICEMAIGQKSAHQIAYR